MSNLEYTLAKAAETEVVVTADCDAEEALRIQSDAHGTGYRASVSWSLGKLKICFQPVERKIIVIDPREAEAPAPTPPARIAPTGSGPPSGA